LADWRAGSKQLTGECNKEEEDEKEKTDSYVPPVIGIAKEIRKGSSTKAHHVSLKSVVARGERKSKKVRKKTGVKV